MLTPEPRLGPLHADTPYLKRLPHERRKRYSIPQNGSAARIPRSIYEYHRIIVSRRVTRTSICRGGDTFSKVSLPRKLIVSGRPAAFAGEARARRPWWAAVEFWSYDRGAIWGEEACFEGAVLPSKP